MRVAFIAPWREAGARARTLCRTDAFGLPGCQEPIINHRVQTDIQTILKLSVPVIVQIGVRRMSLDDVLALGPGAIVEFNRRSDDDLDLLVNNKPIGAGSTVKVGENFGIRISSVDSRQQRIEAMGSEVDPDS